MKKTYSFQENDFLNREKAAEELEATIKMMQSFKRYDGSIAIAINSRWGFGKTYFLSMWENRLINSDTHDNVVHYNAWEYDDCDTTLLPLIYNILSINESEEDDELMKYGFLGMKVIGTTAVKLAMQKVFGDDEKVVDILKDGLDQFQNHSDELKTISKQFKSYYEYRNTLSDSLNSLIPEGGNLWVFIDDLDRCKPSFALETLEDIKHFFNAENIIFVFSVDLDQLAHTVNQIHGDSIDSNSYLRKFFEYVYLLPSPDLVTYVSKTFESDGTESLDRQSTEYLVDLYRKFDYSLREINQNVSHINYFLKKNRDRLESSEDLRTSLRTYLYLLVIRDKFSNKYYEIIHGKYPVSSGATVESEELAYDDNTLKLLKELSGNSKHPLIGLEEYGLFADVNPESFASHMEEVLC